MKNINELKFEEATRYSAEHTWARLESDLITVGISDYAQDQLGEIIFIELPRPGDIFGKDDQFGVVESAKSVSELYMPIAGEVIEINSSLETSPEIVNQDPFVGGWMIKVNPENQTDVDSLLTAENYRDTLS